jgi:NADPH:quinone reductase-like Zn-dependent oxidoreductase
VGPDELLVRIKATSVNRADLYMLRGTYDPNQKQSDGIIAGLEQAGEVDKIGKNVQGFSLGDRVMSICSGSYAEFTAIDHRLVMSIPDSLSYEEAAAFPLTFSIAYNALMTKACLSENRRFFSADSMVGRSVAVSA